MLFPTHVGLNRYSDYIRIQYFSFPHTRGVEPKNLNVSKNGIRFSPHTWG
ncbi:hypothetical protein LEP1GSC086_1586 [Leptospira weilii str. LNT 1234]|nr:hypothetical protein LEP1GSC086_1586 [Leptospira weilii str. LNT 1234]